MPHLFSNILKGKTKHETPQDLVRKARHALTMLSGAGVKDKEVDKARTEVGEYMGLIAQALHGDDGTPEGTYTEEAMIIMRELLVDNMLLLMVKRLPRLDFETRKHVVSAFCVTCKYTPAHAQEPLGLGYARRTPELLGALARGYEDHTIALNCGAMLRDCFRSPQITRFFLESDELLSLMFDYVQLHAFEVASDAFHSFKKLLTLHGDVVTEFLSDDANYDKFFDNYQTLLTSQNYATQRQSLTLLAELLLDQRNIIIMFKYVTSAKNLMDIMNLLRSTSKSIQYEAFHIFKVFVANPKKPDTVKGILISNREKLLRFLGSFLEEREQDNEDFVTEKEDIMGEIERLEQDPTYTLKPSPSMVSHQMKTVMSFGQLSSEGYDGALSSQLHPSPLATFYARGLQRSVSSQERASAEYALQASGAPSADGAASGVGAPAEGSGAEAGAAEPSPATGIATGAAPSSTVNSVGSNVCKTSETSLASIHEHSPS